MPKTIRDPSASCKQIDILFLFNCPKEFLGNWFHLFSSFYVFNVARTIKLVPHSSFEYQALALVNHYSKY